MRCFLALIAVVWAAGLGAQQQAVLVGDYIEGRSNHVFGCYCEWSGESQTGGHEAIVAWQFRGGDYGGVALAGVRAAAVIVGESTLSQGNPPRKSVLVLDSGASQAQQKAAEALLRRRFGQLLGRIIDVHRMPVGFEVGDGAATLKVGNLMTLALRKAVLPDDVLQGSRLWYDPFVPLAESTLAVTVNSAYGGREFDTVWSKSEPGVTGYWGRFALKPE